jgi:hypothetical protein
VGQRLDLVGISEIADMLGVTRQRADKLSRVDSTFPDPVADLRGGRIWLRVDVVAWIKESGRAT